MGHIIYTSQNQGYGALYNWFTTQSGYTVDYGYLYNWDASQSNFNIEYGALYNWNAANYNVFGETICPDGWHVPSTTDWWNLMIYIDPDGTQTKNDAGGYLKATGTTYWDYPNSGATNTYGFNAIGAGIRYYDTGEFSDINRYSYYLSSTDYTDEYYLMGPIIGYDTTVMSSIGGIQSKNLGQVLRLMKDDSTDPGTMTDYDGNIYPTVKINDQVWMAKNLIVEHYNSGTTIPNITSNTEWANDTDGAMCYYNNVRDNSYTAKILSPSGWHIPNSTEWTTLQTTIGGYYSGYTLKLTGYTHWYTPNSGATNSYGFNAVGSGWRSKTNNGNFVNFKYIGWFWASDEYNSTNGYMAQLWHSETVFQISYTTKEDGLAIRLLKDDSVWTAGDTMIGNDGRIYPTIKIGDQVWISCNLAETKYLDGSSIPIVTGDTVWSGLTSYGARCSYDNNESYAGHNIGEIAHSGWHVPTTTEFSTMATYLGGSDPLGYWELIGGYLKETGYLYWDSPNSGATNSVGFNAKGGGERSNTGTFFNLKRSGAWWNHESYTSSLAYNSFVVYDTDRLITTLTYIASNYKTAGISIRLVKDTTSLSNGDSGTTMDYDGNIYPTICIGSQEWMASNLKVIHYTDGTPIPPVTSTTDWANLTNDGMCYYNNNAIYK